jgi:capsular exopolysaccharide synthesis family protein
VIFRKKGSPERARSIYEDFDSQAPETTEFRRIFTRVARADQEHKIRTILFTSAEGGEGKTTSASLFAIVASLHQGLRTCLVDADLHRPRVHRLFGTGRTTGLSDVLGRNTSIENALTPTRYDNLRLITAGEQHPSPSELLVPDRLATMIGRLKLLFDLIVVDSPPLLPVSDPVVLSREVDGVALVLRAGRTQRDVALRARRILDDAGANLLGVIVNNVDDVLPYYYGHTYYHYPERPDERRSGADDGTRSRQDRRDTPPETTRGPGRQARARATGSTG